MKRIIQITSVVALIGAGAAIPLVSASASVPDSNNIIHACYTTSSGALRIIDTDDGGSCYSYETKLTWSASGLKAFTGTDVTSNGYVGSLTETCPDGGIPVELWIGGNSPLDINGAGNQGHESLVYPNGDDTQPPDGIYGDGTTVPKNTQVTYTLICS